jgi:hypothetical protein
MQDTRGIRCTVHSYKSNAIQSAVDVGTLLKINVVLSMNDKRYLIAYSLRRSNVRKKIADYLFEISPECSYASDIAYHIRISPTNVIGALKGMSSRYKPEESLLALNVVEQTNDGSKMKLYRITELGKEVLNSLKRRG